MSSSEESTTGASFWDHFDVLRGAILRIIIAMLIVGAAAFLLKDALFEVILAPKSNDFITYRLLDNATQMVVEDAQIEPLEVTLINTQLTAQFTTHIQMAIYVGFLLVFPYILFEIFRFVSPALYDNERRYALRVVGSGYIMFMMGVALSYFLIFPLTLRFLASYQVSPDVENHIVLSSYIGTMMMLNLMMGIVFEIPVLSWLFAKLGFLTADFMRKYRKHAIVILMVISAIITPTADAVTLLLVCLPMYLLYELSIWIVSVSQKPR